MTNFMRRTGTPCWLDLQTDVERARAFYGAALGWTFTPIGPEFGEWCIARVDGEAVAGVGPGEPRPWQVFLHTDDIGESWDAAGDRVEHHRGRFKRWRDSWKPKHKR